MVEVDFSDDTYGEYLLGIRIAPGDSGAIVRSAWFILTKAEILTENTYLLIYQSAIFPLFQTLFGPSNPDATTPTAGYDAPRHGLYVKVFVLHFRGDLAARNPHMYLKRVSPLILADVYA